MFGTAKDTCSHRGHGLQGVHVILIFQIHVIFRPEIQNQVA